MEEGEERMDGMEGGGDGKEERMGRRKGWKEDGMGRKGWGRGKDGKEEGMGRKNGLEGGRDGEEEGMGRRKSDGEGGNDGGGGRD